MANTGLVSLLGLDFDTAKASLQNFLKSQPLFKDFSFVGSNMNVLLDILSYNTMVNAFTVNMGLSESFIDTAMLRDSVVSIAKSLNYLPRSFRSAKATVSITITPDDANTALVTIPAGTTLTGSMGTNNYTFQTISTVSNTGVNHVFSFPEVDVYEGATVADTFTIDYTQNGQLFVLSNPTIDTTSLTVTSIEDSGSTLIPYTHSTTLLGLTTTSPAFFIQATENNQYQILFGDNIMGRKPSDGAIIVASYRLSSGELPNGCAIFTPDTTIDGWSNVTVTSVTAAIGGAISEDIESIRFYAPLSYSTQERAVTTLDYETLLRSNFPEIAAVTAFGGEDLSPPQYGTVFVSVQVGNLDILPDTKKTEYSEFIQSRCSLGISPVFVDPQNIWLVIDSDVKFNQSETTLSKSDIQALVTAALISYNSTDLDDFSVTAYYSKIVETIDAAHVSIISNETSVNVMQKYVPPSLGTPLNTVVQFNVPLFQTNITETRSVYPANSFKTFHTSSFIYKGNRVMLEDDGNGTVWVVKIKSDGHHRILKVGSITYTNGRIVLPSLQVDSFTGDGVRFYAVPAERDVSVGQHYVLGIAQDEIEISTTALRI